MQLNQADCSGRGYWRSRVIGAGQAPLQPVALQPSLLLVILHNSCLMPQRVYSTVENTPKDAENCRKLPG